MMMVPMADTPPHVSYTLALTIPNDDNVNTSPTPRRTPDRPLAQAPGRTSTCTPAPNPAPNPARAALADGNKKRLLELLAPWR